VAGGKKIDGEWFAYGLSLGLVLLHDFVIFSLLIFTFDTFLIIVLQTFVEIIHLLSQCNTTYIAQSELNVRPHRFLLARSQHQLRGRWREEMFLCEDIEYLLGKV
jgi:hypothetical protein